MLDRSDIGRSLELDEPLDKILDKCGHIPLPPYISRTDEPSDRDRYQTIFASNGGATASPTAGLHFTDRIIGRLKEKGVSIAYITLHVSYGTFAPIKVDVVEKHKMHSEFYQVSPENAEAITKARSDKKRIIACGTTSLRVLETCADEINSNRFHTYEVWEPVVPTLRKCGSGSCGVTDLFIYPGYRFKVVDALITNFHLPKSTLLLLASAFCGKELLFRAYDYAIKNKFRFFSYGDAMLIL